MASTDLAKRRAQEQARLLRMTPEQRAERAERRRLAERARMAKVTTAPLVIGRKRTAGAFPGRNTVRLDDESWSMIALAIGNAARACQGTRCERMALHDLAAVTWEAAGLQNCADKHSLAAMTIMAET